MQDYYLKTTDLNTLWDLLFSAGLADSFTDADGQIVNIPKNISLDIIGTIYKPTGNMIEIDNGLLIEEQLPIDGFHVNIRGNLTEEQKQKLPLITPPRTPYRVWA
jgi:hypothetical protein